MIVLIGENSGTEIYKMLALKIKLVDINLKQVFK